MKNVSSLENLHMKEIVNYTKQLNILLRKFAHEVNCKLYKTIKTSYECSLSDRLPQEA
jgi:hypothetical protein